jgi:hypothetical protein
MTADSPFYRWPKGTTARQVAMIRVHLRRMWRPLLLTYLERVEPSA